MAELEVLREWLQLASGVVVTLFSDIIALLLVAPRTPLGVILLDTNPEATDQLILCQLLRNLRNLEDTMIIGMVNAYDAYHGELPEQLIAAGVSRFLLKPLQASITHEELTYLVYNHRREGWLAREIAEFRGREDLESLTQRLFMAYRDSWNLSLSLAALSTTHHAPQPVISGQSIAAILLFIHRVMDMFITNFQAFRHALILASSEQYRLDDSLQLVRSVQNLTQIATKSITRSSQKIDLVIRIRRCVEMCREPADRTGFADLEKDENMGHTTKNGRLGRGLYLCRRIAALHHAQLKFTNRPTAVGGAQVTLLFPPYTKSISQ